MHAPRTRKGHGNGPTLVDPHGRSMQKGLYRSLHSQHKLCCLGTHKFTHKANYADGTVKVSVRYARTAKCTVYTVTADRTDR